MRCRLHKTEVYCHPAFIALLLLSLFLSAGSLLPSLLALLFHEAGHLFAAELLALPVLQIELLPLGGVMTVQGLSAAPRWKQALLCLGGPVFSLLGLLLSPLFFRVGSISFAFTKALIRSHFLLLLLNLVPVLPLDGGRCMKAVFSRFIPPESLERALRIMTTLAASFLCLLSLLFALRGQISFSPAFAGVFLLYAHEAEKRKPALTYVSALIARRRRLARNEIIPVERIAVSRNTPYVQILSAFSGAAYHQILVLTADGMEEAAFISEKAFCEAVMQNPDGSMIDLMPTKNSTEP